MDTLPEPVLPQRPQGRFLGRVAFQQLVRDAFACAAHEGWREIFISDSNFEDWPLGERAVCAALQSWARSGRRFTMLAQNFEEVVRRHARFVEWRVTWSHLVECRAWRSADPLELPSALCSPEWMMRRLDPLHCSGLSTDDAASRIQLRQTLDTGWQKGSPAFASSVLGL
ncbi:MAG: hypothetical protein NTZ15_11330 [Burkholderiales bacterium]|nr:hypothetical protein [Burkholderiales bacterium]